MWNWMAQIEVKMSAMRQMQRRQLAPLIEWQKKINGMCENCNGFD